MDIFTILQIIIALIFIFFIVSLLVSELQEQLSALKQSRAENLKKAINNFVGPNFAKNHLYNQNSLFSGFSQYTNEFSGKALGPSYIKPQVFASLLLALINKELDAQDKLSPSQELFPTSPDSQEQDIISKLDSILSKLDYTIAKSNCTENEVNDSANDDSDKQLLEVRPKNYKALIERLKDYQQVIPRLKDIAYTTKLQNDNPTVKDFTKEIANTFDKALERTSGVYKRKSKRASLIFGIIVALLLNIDTFYIVDHLYNDPALRQGFDNLATEIVEANKNCLEAANNNQEEINKCKDKFKTNTEKLNKSFAKNQTLPVGWGENGIIKNDQNVFLAVLGWVISAIAISMGAPFWFELLGKVINVRNTVRPSSSQEKTTEVTTSNTSSDEAVG